jgi:hypothetical protein
MRIRSLHIRMCASTVTTCSHRTGQPVDVDGLMGHMPSRMRHACSAAQASSNK